MSNGNRRVGKAQQIAVALAAALATSVASSDSEAAQLNDAIRRVERYCAASWRAAGIPQQEWADCTQEVLTRLLERLGQPRSDCSAQAYRELKRAVWSTAKAYQRRPRGAGLLHEGLTRNTATPDETLARTEWFDRLLQQVTPRQRRILELWLAGASIGEIARDLGLPAERVSDEKYKALRRIKQIIAAEADSSS